MTKFDRQNHRRFYLSQTFPKEDNAQKMKFSIKDLFSKCEQIRTISDFVTFTEEIFNGKLQFLYSDNILGM